MQNSLISIIVPVYKVEDYLEKCIDSIINQTYKDLEIILVDDGSPDICPQICDDYAARDDRIRVIHKENGGLSDARNAGLDLATGDYIGFVDSDDYIAPDMYELMLESIQKNNADICICGYKQVKPNGDVICIKSESERLLSREEAFQMVLEENVFYAIMCNKLFARSIFSNNLRFSVGKIYEDEFIIHHLYNKCEYVSVIENCGYYYLCRENSIMHSAKHTSREFDDVEVYIDRAKFFLEINKTDYSAQLLCRVADDAARLYRLVEHNYVSTQRIKKIQSEFSQIKNKTNLHSLKKFRRFGLTMFSYNFYAYLIWNRIISAIDKIYIKF